MNNTTTTATDAYIPGVCNINYEEIASRRKAGYFGVGVFAILLIALLVFDIPRFVRVFLFLPAFVAAIGFLQAKNKFCVGYGAAGMQNAADGSKSASKISDKSAVTKDKSRAQKMNIQAAGYGMLATIVALLIPSFS